MIRYGSYIRKIFLSHPASRYWSPETRLGIGVLSLETFWRGLSRKSEFSAVSVLKIGHHLGTFNTNMLSKYYSFHKPKISCLGISAIVAVKKGYFKLRKSCCVSNLSRWGLGHLSQVSVSVLSRSRPRLFHLQQLSPWQHKHNPKSLEPSNRKPP